MTAPSQETRQDGPSAAAGALPAPSGGGDTPQAVARASGAPVAVTVDLWPHALTEEGRDTHPALVPAGTTLAELVRLEAGAWREDVGEVLVDGAPVPRERWAGVAVSEGQTVTVHAGAQGGNPLRALFQILTLVAAVFVPPLLGLTGVAAALTSAAISVVGGLITNALFPVRAPEIGGSAQPDPVYSLAGGSNRARLYEPLPLVLGEHRVFPDLGAKEYTEYDGDNQFLYQIFNFGPGDLDISELRIDSSPVADYAEVTTERGDAQGRIALVAGNVDTATGAALQDTGWITRQTGADTNSIGIDITGRLFSLNDRGEEEEQSVTIEVRWWKVGENAPAAANRRQVITNDSQTPVRQTLAAALPERATWNVSVRRTTEPSDADRVYDEMTWAALRSYQPDNADYTGQNRLGVKIRASGQLSGRLDRVSALVRQKIPAWDATTESWGAANITTSNPAAVFLWYARGVRIAGRPAAGVGLPDSRIDLAGLGAWFEWCHAQGLRCDYEIKGGMTHDAVLTLIAQCGRASVSWQTGKLGVVYEDSARIPSGLVTPGNVVKGSFRYEYAQGEIADEVIVRYIEPDLDWQYNSVRRSRPGLVGTPQSSVTITAKGVTQRDQAAVECNLQTARQHYHRRRLVWEMGREGRSFTKGSVVWITHSLIDGGIVGRLEAVLSPTLLRLDKAVDVGADDYLLLRLPNGTLHQSGLSRPADQPANGEIDTVQLATAPPAAVSQAEPVDVIWRLYDSALPPAKARIVAFEPISDRRFRLTAINEDAAYHALATSDLSAPFPSVVVRIPSVIAVQFSAVRARAGDTYATEVQAALTVAGEWRGAVVRAGAAASRLATVAHLVGGDTVARWTVPSDVSGQVVEIVPGTERQPTGPVWRGRWDRETLLPPNPTGFAVTEIQGNVRQLACVPPGIPDLAGVRIRFSDDAEDEWAAMSPLADGPIRAFPYWVFVPEAAGTYSFEARTEDTGGELSSGVRISVELDELDFVGEDGSAREFIFRATTTGTAPATPTTTDTQDATADFVPAGWHDDPVAGNVVWVSSRKRATAADKFSKFSAPIQFNGRGIRSISKTGSTVTITLDDGSTDTFTVADGTTIASITRAANGTVTVTYGDGTTSTFTVADGNGIRSISRNSNTGVVTITFDDGTTQSFTVSDGAVGGTSEWIYRATTTGTRPSTPATSSVQDRTNDFVPRGWQDDPPTSGKYIWVSKRTRATGGAAFSKFSAPIQFNGRGIRSISKTGSTVTITLDDGSTDTFTVADGTTIASITRAANGTVTVTYGDGTTSTFTVADGNGIRSISRNSNTGVVTITFDDGTTQSFTVSDGAVGGTSEWIYRATTTGTRPSTPATSSVQDRTNDFVPRGWQDDPPTSGKYIWVSKRTRATGGAAFSKFSTPSPFRGPPGNDGTIITAWYDQIRFANFRTTSAVDTRDAEPPTPGVKGNPPTTGRPAQARYYLLRNITFSDARQADGSIHGTATATYDVGPYTPI